MNTFGGWDDAERGKKKAGWRGRRRTLGVYERKMKVLVNQEGLPEGTVEGEGPIAQHGQARNVGRS